MNNWHITRKHVELLVFHMPIDTYVGVGWGWVVVGVDYEDESVRWRPE